jgi:hypothetical protein
MQVQNVMSLSLGEWAAIMRGWNRAHSDKVDPPSVEEFEAAMLAANGVA